MIATVIDLSLKIYKKKLKFYTLLQFKNFNEKRRISAKITVYDAISTFIGAPFQIMLINKFR